MLPPSQSPCTSQLRWVFPSVDLHHMAPQGKYRASCRRYPGRVVSRHQVLAHRPLLRFREYCQQARRSPLLQLQSASASSIRARGAQHTARCCHHSSCRHRASLPMNLIEPEWDTILVQAVRDNGRIALSDKEYAEHLWQALGLQPALAGITVDRAQACGLNPNIRIYRCSLSSCICNAMRCTT